MPSEAKPRACAGVRRSAVTADSLALLRLLAALIVTASASAACSRKPEPAPPQAPPAAATAADSIALARGDRARIQGSELARVWLVIASDFQCPFCRAFHHETYGRILSEYVATGKVRVAFLNHPAPNHRFALVAAEAAMCAGMQDRFWPMHDGLFVTQSAWSASADPRPVFDSLATALNLRMDDWRRCVAGHQTLRLIEADHMRSRAGGVTGTPSFFIGDRLAIVGAEPYPKFKAALDAAIAQAGGPPGGSGRRP
jgi:protein-disulfide isomerase